MHDHAQSLKGVNRLGLIEGWLSVVVNTLLFGAKFGVGMLTGSVAMIAEAWHTLSDSITSVILLVGFKVSARRPDARHPYGHGRAELIAALLIGSLLAVVGVKFLEASVLRLRAGQAASFDVLSIVVFAAAGLVKEAMARFSIWAGRRTQSTSLKADGWHHRSDALASFLVAVGALAGRYAWWIDGAMGVVVSLLFLHAAYEIVTDAADSLMGEATPETVQRQVRETIRAVDPRVREAHHFRIHRYGNRLELVFHARLPSDLSLEEAHRCVSRLESALHERLALYPTIHIEPYAGTSRGVNNEA